jgi:hypothetical protein
MPEEPQQPRHDPTTAQHGQRADSGEAGRYKTGTTAHRTARDSTSINPKAREPIDPRMPHLPPA